MQPRFERQFIKWQTSWKSKNRCARRRRSKRKKRYPADFSQFCFILAHAEMPKEPLDIWREWHFSDDSDLEILSELIRLYPRFRCPNSSFSPQLCIDIQYISNRCGLYRSHRMETSQGGFFCWTTRGWKRTHCWQRSTTNTSRYCLTELSDSDQE